MVLALIAWYWLSWNSLSNLVMVGWRDVFNPITLNHDVLGRIITSCKIMFIFLLRFFCVGWWNLCSRLVVVLGCSSSSIAAGVVEGLFLLVFYIITSWAWPCKEIMNILWHGCLSCWVFQELDVVWFIIISYGRSNKKEFDSKVWMISDGHQRSYILMEVLRWESWTLYCYYKFYIFL